MFHEHAAPVGDDPALGYKKKVGVRLFFVYGAFYVGFIAVNLIKPAVMERIVLYGLDLAVVYGFGLILSAVLFALVYNRLCTRMERRLKSPGAPGTPPGASPASNDGGH